VSANAAQQCCVCLFKYLNLIIVLSVLCWYNGIFINKFSPQRVNESSGGGMNSISSKSMCAGCLMFYLLEFFGALQFCGFWFCAQKACVLIFPLTRGGSPASAHSS
jgi:hypothetical protein